MADPVFNVPYVIYGLYHIIVFPNFPHSCSQGKRICSRYSISNDLVVILVNILVDVHHDGGIPVTLLSYVCAEMHYVNIDGLHRPNMTYHISHTHRGIEPACFYLTCNSSSTNWCLLCIVNCLVQVIWYLYWKTGNHKISSQSCPRTRTRPVKRK